MAENTTQLVQDANTPSDMAKQSQNNSENIILIVQGTSIPCNKSLLTAASPYFAAMFRGNFSEAQACTVPIHDITASSIQAIVDHLQGGSFNWDALDPLDILYTASVLQLDDIQTDCVQFISNGLNTQSCLSVMFKAEQLGLDRLYESASLMSQWAFETIIESESFRSLSYDEVSRYLGGDLLVSSEGKVIEAICTWIKQEEQERKKHMRDLLQLLEYSQISLTELLCHSFQLNNFSILFNYEPWLLKTCISFLKHFSSTVWARVQWGRKIEESPVTIEEKHSRDVPAKLYLLATGVRRHPESFIYPMTYSNLRHKEPPEYYLQYKLCYLCPDHQTVKLSSLNNYLQREDIGTAVKIFPVESEVWVVAKKEETVENPVFSLWKFNAVLQRWVYIKPLPTHIRDFIDWLVYVKNHIYILYEPFGQVTEQVIDVYNVVTKQWTQLSLPYLEDMKNLEEEKAKFFSYQSHLYIIASWFHAGISLRVTSSSLCNEWKKINWCSYEKKDEHEILQCVVDKADIYGLSFNGFFKLEIKGENVLRCDYISEYMYANMLNDHDLCFRLFSKKIQVLAGRIYCWRKSESWYLSVFDVDKRGQRDTDLQYESSDGSYETRWHGFYIVLDSCFVLPDRLDTLTDE